MKTFTTNNGNFTGNFYEWLYHDQYPANSYFKISPEGKYIFNSAGTVFYATDDKSDDMTYVTSIKGEFKDIAFDTAANKFYTASSNNTINVYDYTDFRLLGKYNTSDSIQNIFVHGSNVVIVTKDTSGKYSINTMPKQNILDGLHLDNPSDGVIPDNIISAVYDSSKNKVYAVDSAFNKLLIMDAATDTLEKTIDLKYRPSAITLSEDGTKLYIVNEDTRYLVSKIDLNTLTNTANLKFTADGKYFFKLKQYSFAMSFAGNDILKYSINGNSIKLEESSNSEAYSTNTDPIDTAT